MNDREENCQEPKKAAAIEEVAYDLPEVVVASNSSSEVVSRRLGPGCYFRPTGFRIPDDVANDLLITDIKVGKNSQFYSAGAVPAGLFAESASGAQLRMDHLGPGTRLTLSIHNVSNRSVTFRGQVRGFATPAAEDLPDYNKMLAVMGLGFFVMSSGIDRATINVETLVDLVPCRLYVPSSVLDEYDVDLFTSEGYLNTAESSRVPALMLRRENLAGEGLIEFEPVAVLLAQSFFSIGIARRVKDRLTRPFSGAVLAVIK